MITCTPDLGIEMPFQPIPYAELKERAAAACQTINTLVENGLPEEVLTPDAADRARIATIVNSFAEDEVKTNEILTTERFSNLPPAVLIGVHDTLKDFSHAVVKQATQIRHLVTNKLILETSNPDPRVRIKALELLGKISDVGLFTERSEVTVTHRSTDDLKSNLREKLEVLRRKAQEVEITDVEMRELGVKTVEAGIEEVEKGVEAAKQEGDA
jgi:hypothetical protein